MHHDPEEDFPHTVTMADGPKLQVSWDVENEVPELKVDGFLYSALPYLDPDFSLENAQLPKYIANLNLNKKVVTKCDEAIEWEP